MADAGHHLPAGERRNLSPAERGEAEARRQVRSEEVPPPLHQTGDDPHRLLPRRADEAARRAVMMEQHWYAGLPVVGSRELTVEERAEVQRLFRRLLGNVALNAAVLIGVAVIVLVAVNLGQVTDWTGPIALVLSLSLIRQLPQLRWYSIISVMRLRRDARAGYVERCEGGGMRLEVLPHSALIWRLNDRETDYPRFAHAAATAPPPAHAALAAQFVKPATDDGRVLVHQRALTADEGAGRGRAAAAPPPPPPPRARAIAERGRRRPAAASSLGAPPPPGGWGGGPPCPPPPPPSSAV